MQESGQLQFLPTPKTGNYGFAPDLKMDVIFVDGHTEKQMLPVIQYQEKTIVFAARFNSNSWAHSASLCDGI